MINFLFVICFLSYAAAQNIDGRIVGGHDTTITEHPFLVSVRYCNGGQHICGGTLIKPNRVVTAGHCVEITITDCFDIRAGSTNNTVGGEVISVNNTAEFVVRHPNYTSSTADYDVAVFMLPTNFTIGGDINVIGLPAQGYVVPSGSNATLTGWGYLNETSSIPSDILQEIFLPVVSQSTCNRWYSNTGGITSRMICAGNSGTGQGICFGDSGGPMVVGGIFQGIASRIRGCGTIARSPPIYTRTASHVNFIVSV